LRSFVWWTAPLYVGFLFAGLYAEHFVLTSTVTLLIGLLLAFGLLDAIVLVRIASIRARPIETLAELHTTREQIERLARMLLVGGGAFGAAFLMGIIMLVLL
jgi:hypothetical protein